MKTKTILLLVALGGMTLSLLTFEQWDLGTLRRVGTGFILGYLVCQLVGIFSPRRR